MRALLPSLIRKSYGPGEARSPHSTSPVRKPSPPSDFSQAESPLPGPSSSLTFGTRGAKSQPLSLFGLLSRDPSPPLARPTPYELLEGETGGVSSVTSLLSLRPPFLQSSFIPPFASFVPWDNEKQKREMLIRPTSPKGRQAGHPPPNPRNT